MEKQFEVFVRLHHQDTRVMATMQIRSGWPEEEATVEEILIYDPVSKRQMPLHWLPLESDRLRVHDYAYALAQDLNETAWVHERESMADSAIEDSL